MQSLSLPDPFQYAYQAPIFEADFRYEQQLFDFDDICPFYPDIYSKHPQSLNVTEAALRILLFLKSRRWHPHSPQVYPHNRIGWRRKSSALEQK